MNKLLLLAAALLLSGLSAFAQTYTVTPSTTTYAAAGGQITFTVTITYPTTATVVSFSAKPSASTWIHSGTSGLNTPSVAPNVGDSTIVEDPSSVFGWVFGGSEAPVPPNGSVTFAFTLQYPANLNGSQTITFGGNYHLNNVETKFATSTIALTSAPEFTSQPQNSTAAAGGDATFTVTARGGPTPTLKWQRSIDGGLTWSNVDDGSAFSGTSTGSLTVKAVTPAMNGQRFRAVATSAGFAAVNSNAAMLSVQSGPVFVVHPRGQAVALGGTLRLSAVVTGDPAPALQWKKGTSTLSNGGRVSGATTANLVISNVEAGDAGSYSVVATNSIASNVASENATITIAPAGYAATHTLQGAGYVAGGTITISTSISFAGEISSLGYSVILPSGWSFVSGAGTVEAAPAAGTVGSLTWAWTNVGALTSPVNFSYTVSVPSGTTGTYYLAGTAIIANAAAEQFSIAAASDPLVVGPVLYHSADTNGDFKISLSELLRVISYYNTRFTNPDNTRVQTGAYRQQAIGPSAPDGFGPDSTKSSTAPAGQGGLAAYHSADTDRNAAIGLSELLRVISYFNTRYTNPDNTKVQTGAYRVKTTSPASPDGYEPDPGRAP